MADIEGVRFMTCPHCGDQPTISTAGSCIDVDCCACMSVQKSDVLTLSERLSYDPRTHLFSRAAEEKALRVTAAYWNKRTC